MGDRNRYEDFDDGRRYGRSDYDNWRPKSKQDNGYKRNFRNKGGRNEFSTEPAPRETRWRYEREDVNPEEYRDARRYQSGRDESRSNYGAQYNYSVRDQERRDEHVKREDRYRSERVYNRYHEGSARGALEIDPAKNGCYDNERFEPRTTRERSPNEFYPREYNRRAGFEPGKERTLPRHDQGRDAAERNRGPNPREERFGDFQRRAGPHREKSGWNSNINNHQMPTTQKGGSNRSDGDPVKHGEPCDWNPRFAGEDWIIEDTDGEKSGETVPGDLPFTVSNKTPNLRKRDRSIDAEADSLGIREREASPRAGTRDAKRARGDKAGTND